MTAHEVKSSSDLRQLPIRDRKCRFADETEGVMTVLGRYTQSGCQFECMLEKSRAACRCTPWNYPRPPNDTLGTCDLFGNYCFEMIMRKKEKLTKCRKCEPDCQVGSKTILTTTLKTILSVLPQQDLYFTFTEKEAPLDAKTFCAEDSETFKYLLDDEDVNVYPFLMRNVPSWARKEDYYKQKNARERCQDRITQDVVGVSVHFAMQRYVKHLQSRRVTFSDRIANLGDGSQFPKTLNYN